VPCGAETAIGLSAAKISEIRLTLEEAVLIIEGSLKCPVGYIPENFFAGFAEQKSKMTIAQCRLKRRS
jgi:hypothetical protein